MCLQHFSQERILNEHTENCLAINGTQGIKMPPKGSKVNFVNYHKQLEVPFVIYAESILYQLLERCQLLYHHRNLHLLNHIKII